MTFDDWWHTEGINHMPRGDQPPEHAAIAKLAWEAAVPKQVLEKFKEHCEWVDEQARFLVAKFRVEGDKAETRTTARAYFNCAMWLEEMFALNERMREPMCAKCEHSRASHSEEMPYDCQDDCDCDGFAYVKVSRRP